MFWCYENGVAKMVLPKWCCQNGDGNLAVAYASERYDV